MCKAKGNIQLSGLSSERREEHQRQNLIHSWIFWNCSNYTNVLQTKKTRRKAKQTQAELSALKGRGCCPLPALPQPSAPQCNLSGSDWPATVHWCVL